MKQRLQPDSIESLRPKTDADLTDMALAQRAAVLAPAFQGRLPSAAELRNITEELGVEIATAVFLRTLQDSNLHGPFGKQVRSFDFAGWDQTSVRAAQVEVTIIASNSFLSSRKWGDHVDTWRLWARDLGFTTDVIETDPRRSVAANARLIFEYLARAPNRERIIVTYGQGASEFRYLLHRRVNRDPRDMLPEEVAGIRAWINVCGSFAGATTSRRSQENRLKRLLLRLRMKVAGRNPITLAETSSLFPLWRRPLPMPPGLLITSLIGVPYRPQIPVGTGLNLSYDDLARSSPNDGVVTVLEAAAHPGYLVPIPGMSHRAEDRLLEPFFKRLLGVIATSMGITEPVDRKKEKPEYPALELELELDQTSSQIPRKR